MNDYRTLGKQLARRMTRHPSNYLLVVANLVPVFGALIYGWDALLIIAAYFLETILIGLLNMVKMALILATNPRANEGITGVKGWGLISFFAVHYGFFILIQLFVFTGFISAFDPRLAGLSNPLLELYEFFRVALAPEGWLLMGGLAASHLFALVFDFLLPGTYRTGNAGEQMFRPYGRIIIQQIIVVFGGFLLFIFRSPLPLLLLLMLLKTVADLGGQTILLERPDEADGIPVPAGSYRSAV